MTKVQLYIYDLSQGLALQLSPLFLGKQIDGIWHTGVVVYGKEFFFGGGVGIEFCHPGGTILGQPHQVQELGETEVPEDLFQEFLIDLGPRFGPDTYNLLEHNCNTFSNEVAQFLTGNSIPAYITNLPSEVLQTPFGSQIRPFLEMLSGPSSGGQPVSSLQEGGGAGDGEGSGAGSSSGGNS